MYKFIETDQEYQIRLSMKKKKRVSYIPLVIYFGRIEKKIKQNKIDLIEKTNQTAHKINQLPSIEVAKSNTRIEPIRFRLSSVTMLPKFD